MSTGQDYRHQGCKYDNICRAKVGDSTVRYDAILYNTYTEYDFTKMNVYMANL